MKVRMVGLTANPMNAICMAIAIMKERDPFEAVRGMTEIDKQNAIQEILKSRLRGALEFASFEFLLEDVTRAFTHQLVRHRAFHFSQQSMRFFDAGTSGFRSPNIVEPANRFMLQNAVQNVMDTYSKLIKAGVPTEDARSILPTNVCTKIMFGATLRGLIELAEVRMCWQAQGEFREAMELIKKEVEMVSPFLGGLLVSACERSGECEFKSVYDRECPIENERKRR